MVVSDFPQLLRENGLKVTPHRLRVLAEITQKSDHGQGSRQGDALPHPLQF